MGEAIFAKYSKGINPSTLISNSTKEAFGLNNNATLDDCLAIIGLKDSNTATVKVTLKDIDGTLLGNHKIMMSDPSGMNLIYTTDGSGTTIFKTSNGQAILSDWSNNSYCDVGYPTNIAVDLPLGSVKTITLQRYKSLENNGNLVFNSNGWANFSKYADKCDVELRGESGQGGGSASRTGDAIARGSYCQITAYGSYAAASQSGCSSSKYVSWISCLKFWTVSPSAYMDYSLHTYDIQNMARINSGIISAQTKGGNGGLGEITISRNINIHNKNFNLVIYPAYNKTFVGVNNNSFCSSSKILIPSLSQGTNGNSGRSTTGFGLVANGGKGGEKGNVYQTNIRDGNSFGEGLLSGFPGENRWAASNFNVTLGNQGLTAVQIITRTSGYYDYYHEQGNSCPGQIIISNFQYK